ncbi:hypothetical protein DVH24_017765 [Malus domestica]|uniref:Phytocyanin domain-containing protein n=1 Tax=Malus domestica TaxID=3750 RepID=A0A498KK58_MALDO|nr:hypothetical protein DVH24_017765 [Malus domestica]
MGSDKKYCQVAFPNTRTKEEEKMIKAMNFRNVMVLAIAVATVATMSHTTAATEYVVGDDLGWTVPPGGAAYYVSWAANHSFVLNDVLHFKFIEGEHTVAMVTKENFEICNTTNPIFELQKPSIIGFTASDTYYFTCTIAGHCAEGQKIAVYFAPSSNTPSPSPSGAPPTPATSLPPVKFVENQCQS